MSDRPMREEPLPAALVSAPQAGGAGERPGPQAAYARWTEACAAAGWRPAPGAEQAPVRDGLGRVLAAPVLARWSAPSAACAAMDGIAIRAWPPGSPADAVSDASAWRELAASSYAWVDTGKPLPPGMDTIVERERVTFGAGGTARITGPAPRGSHVRPAGEDFMAGQLLIPAGHRLRPADLAVAATAGHATLELARQPVAAIIPTGDEIRPIGSALRPGEVTDSNSLLLASRAREIGALPVISDVQPDDQAALVAEVRRAALRADLVLVIAGSSAGRSDHAAAVLAQAGALVIRGVAVRPGHPALLGYARRDQVPDDEPAAIVPVIGVPGYPLAAALIFELFAVPLLAALQGARHPDPPRQRAELTCDWTSPAGVEDWVPVTLTAVSAGEHDVGAVLATPTGRGAGATSRLMRAGAWWPIPIGRARFSRGEQISVQPMPGAPP